MKIFIEGSSMFNQRWGIGQFTKRLVEAYHREYPNQQIRLFGFKFITRTFTPPLPADKYLGYRLIRWLPGKIYNGLFKYGFGIPVDVLLGASRRDVIIFPNFVRWPLLFNRQSIAFIHDISFVKYGQFTSPANRSYMLRHVPPTVKKADHIVTISESSRIDISKHYQVPAEKISVVTPFIDTGFFKRSSAAEVKRVSQKLHLPEQYFLFTGTIEPRKNIMGILEAYEILNPNIKQRYGLVLAGGKGWLDDDIHKKIEGLRSKGWANIVLPGYIDDNDIVGLFSGASLFIFISHYEGFGIPPLEAMACGVPVIVSDNSSLPEVVGNAGKLVSADDPKQTADAITYLLEHPDLCAKMVSNGYAQVKKFNPSRSAKQLQAVIDKIRP